MQRKVEIQWESRLYANLGFLNYFFFLLVQYNGKEYPSTLNGDQCLEKL